MIAILLRWVYSLLGYLLIPVAVGTLIWRGFKNRAYWQRIGERFGWGPSLDDASVIWVHAVSVGEVQAARPLVKALMVAYPDYRMVMTTVTPTGAERVAALFGDQVTHRYIPYDLPGAVRRFFNQIRPQLAIVIETELWPNLYRECGLRQVPLVLASARISPRSVRKYQRLTALFGDALSHGIVIAAQSEADAERFLSLGAVPSRTRVTGNIKFDISLDPEVAEAARALRQQRWGERPSWVAASTHEGEDALILAAHEKVLATFPDAVLVLVPRHPERFDRVASLIDESDLEFVRRSDGDVAFAPGHSVFLGDTLGELMLFYGAVDIAFVAGSLVPIGGHNLLEPAALGLPIVTGPYNFNAEEIADELLRVGGVRKVPGADALAGTVIDLLQDDGAREELGRAAKACLDSNRGAVDRLLRLIRPLL